MKFFLNRLYLIYLSVFFCSIFFVKAQTQLGQTLIEEAPGDEFGESIAMNIDGSVMAIGAVLNDGNGTNSGTVQIFAFNETTNQWEQRGQNIDGQLAGDFAGTSVSLNIDGTRVAIGSNGNGTGQVRVFSFDDATNEWGQLGEDLTGVNTGDGFGFSLRMNAAGTRIIVGSFRSDTSLVNNGNIQMFEFVSQNWIPLGSSIAGNFDNGNFGIVTTMNELGDIVASSEPFDNEGITRVFMFNENTGEWAQKGQSILGENDGDGGGWRIDLNGDGNRIAISSLFVNQVRIFDFNENTSLWEQVGNSIEDSMGSFGVRMSLSSLGDVVAVGSNGLDQEGGVTIFRLNESTNVWGQAGDTIFGEVSGEGANEVEISSDGRRVAIGSPFTTVSVTRVRVFDFSEVLAVDDVQVSEALLEVYPNPTVDSFRINTSLTSIENVSIYDALGRLVRTFEDSMIADRVFDISSLKNGLYYVNFETAGNNSTRKILKN